MKVEIIDNDLEVELDDIESGTLILFRDNLWSDNFSYGILLKDIDDKNPIIYDIKKDTYYTDTNMYNIKVVCNRDVKLVVE